MKNNLLYVFIAALSVVLVFVWQYSQYEKTAVSSNPDLLSVKKALFSLQQEQDFKQLTKQQKLKKVYQVLEQLPPKYKLLKQQYQIAMSDLPDISVWGRVIDQYNQPVINADVYYAGTNTYLAVGGGRGFVKTDAEGYFEIHTSGERLSLWGIRHPRVEEGGYSKSTNKNLNIKSSNMYPDWSKHNTKNNPYIILAWRLGKYEGAISGGVDGDYDGNGKVYTLLLDQRIYKNRRKEGKTAGHIYISCTRPHMESNRDYGDWEVHITPINGGIQETNDLYLNIAPESGYQPSVDIVMKKGGQRYKHELTKQYYFSSNYGKEYGSLNITLQPFWNVNKEACSIDISYKINPTGSRNLELKRSNTSRPQLPTSQKLARNQRTR